ncbi:hypothetical protein H4R20_006962, partial [Coemansia guatemalensis]
CLIGYLATDGPLGLLVARSSVKLTRHGALVAMIAQHPFRQPWASRFSWLCWALHCSCLL